MMPSYTHCCLRASVSARSVVLPSAHTVQYRRRRKNGLQSKRSSRPKRRNKNQNPTQLLRHPLRKKCRRHLWRLQRKNIKSTAISSKGRTLVAALFLRLKRLTDRVTTERIFGGRTRNAGLTAQPYKSKKFWNIEDLRVTEPSSLSIQRIQAYFVIRNLKSIVLQNYFFIWVQVIGTENCFPFLRPT